MLQRSKSGNATTTRQETVQSAKAPLTNSSACKGSASKLFRGSGCKRTLHGRPLRRALCRVLRSLPASLHRCNAAMLQHCNLYNAATSSLPASLHRCNATMLQHCNLYNAATSAMLQRCKSRMAMLQCCGKRCCTSAMLQRYTNCSKAQANQHQLFKGSGCKSTLYGRPLRLPFAECSAALLLLYVAAMLQCCNTATYTMLQPPAFLLQRYNTLAYTMLQPLRCCNSRCKAANCSVCEDLANQVSNCSVCKGSGAMQLGRNGAGPNQTNGTGSWR